MISQTKRVLRYIGNRPEPEPELFDPIERVIHQFPLLEAIAHRDLPKLFQEIPDPMFSDFEKPVDSVLFLPKTIQEQLLTLAFQPALQRWGRGFINKKPKPTPVEPEFETNLIEALVGWKKWYLVESGFWRDNLSTMHDCIWMPDQATEAKCDEDSSHISPAFHHTCGIYAVDTIDQIREYEPQPRIVIGQIYGWGKYVRGDQGWRAQFAYPKSFLLRSEQAMLVEPLRKYHVPIYVEQPLQVYDPSEDGYEYGQDEKIRSSGADQESDPEEETC